MIAFDESLPMAEGAFALSPLSASARTAAPTDADYEAIREAFMETARGRWFLGEYAKRNRNADTAMVLEAVARIEQSMAAAKAEQAAPPEPPSLEPVLTVLRDVRSSIEAILAEPLFEDELGRWRRSSRIIQEIAWALRETGSDPRICDILDSQVRSIAATCDEFPSGDLRSKILGALDAAIREIAPESEASAATERAEARAGEAAIGATAIGPPLTEAVAETPAPAASLEPEMAAAEESAIEPITTAAIEDVSPVIATVAEAAPAKQLVVQQAVSPEPAPKAAITPVLPEPTHPPVSDAAPAPSPSLGESLIAQGLIKQPLSGRADPLAPIRRMSQAEKIAFFS